MSIVEARPRSSTDFHQREARPTRRSTRKARAQDGRQGDQHPAGRCVGGSTTVNWTSSFRTPPPTLTALAIAVRPHRLRPERSCPGSRFRPSGAQCRPWLMAPNENNELLRPGARPRWASPAGDQAQRQRLLEPGLLRHGLPDQRQAVDAGHDDSGGARAARRCWCRRARVAAASRATGSRRCAAWPVALDGHPAGVPATLVKRGARRRLPAARSIRRPCCCAPSCRSARPARPAHLPASGGDHGGAVRAAVEGWHGAPQTVYLTISRQPIDGAIGFKLEARRSTR